MSEAIKNIEPLEIKSELELQILMSGLYRQRREIKARLERGFEDLPPLKKFKEELEESLEVVNDLLKRLNSECPKN